MDELLNKLRAWQYKILLFIQHFGKRADNTVNTLSVSLALLCLGNVIWQIGFQTALDSAEWMVTFNAIAIGLFGIIQAYKFLSRLLSTKSISLWQLAYLGSIWSYIIYADANTEFLWMSHRLLVDAIVCLISVYELSSLSLNYLTRKSTPTILFAGSFLIFIAIGTGLLIMPRCHYNELSFLEALFMSTSSVCVTCLAPFDIQSTFTPFGQTIILLLCQVGGLGVMTFTCFFALSLAGKGSLQNRIVIKDLISADNMSDIFQTLKHIMYVTFIIEGLTSWILFYYFKEAMPGAQTSEVAFTAVFHSIAAFCNAGISNLPHGLENPLIANNNLLHITLALTVILGGLGFPLQSAAINWTKTRLKHLGLRLIGRRHKENGENHRLRVISASNRLVFWTTFYMLLFGTVFFLIAEANQTQAGMGVIDRIVDALFLTATSHAGFVWHSVSDYTMPTQLVLMIFMWIGTAPLATGGGIKVTTFALGILNLRNVLLGRENIEIFGRSVSPYSLRRAFATMSLSFICIFASTIALKVAMPEMETAKLFFESLSALSTSGISMDVTPQLNTAGLLIIIVDMFVGRIGVLAFLLIFITPQAPQRYKYPSENIML